MASDPQLAQTIKEIKDKDLGFAEDMTRDPVKRGKTIDAFVRNKHIRFALGFGLFIFVINAVTSFGRWWFQFPFLFVGLIAYMRWMKDFLSLSKMISEKREKIFNEETAHLADGSEATGKELLRIERRVRSSIRFYRSVYIYLGVNTFLFLINLLTTPFNWWFRFPLSIWAFFLFLHWMKVKKRLPG